MLSFGALGSGKDRYYTALAREDYYLDGGEPPGVWWGKGLAGLGLEPGDRVKAQDLHNLVRGFSRQGDALVQNAGSKARNQGWDLCFSAPKSVSVLWALSTEHERKRIERALWASVRSTLSVVEREHCRVARGSAGRIREPGRITAALFLHSTSRAGDMNLHIHALIPNNGQRPDGSWGALRWMAYSRKLEIGEFFRSSLRARMERLGFQAEADPRGRERFGFRLKVIPQSVERAFSKRRAAIEKTLAERGESSAREAERAALRTRPRKKHESRQQLFGRWEAEARDLGFVLADARRPPALEKAVCTTTECTRFALAHSMKSSEPVAEREPVPRTPGGEGREQSVHPSVTLLRGARQLQARGVLRVVDYDGSTNGEPQLKNLRSLSGPGRPVIVLSPTRAGAAWLSNQTGMSAMSIGSFFFRRSRTLVDRVRHDVRQIVRAARRRSTYGIARPKVKPGTTILVHAAHGARSDDLAKLLDLSSACGAQLVLVGDSHARQTLFSSLSRGPSATKRISERRPDWLEDAREALGKADLESAQMACAFGKVREQVSSTDAQVQRLVSLQDEASTTSTIIAPSRQEALRLNAEAQENRRGFFRVATHRGGRFYEGDRVFLHRSSPPLGVQAGDLGVIERIARKPLKSATLLVRLDRTEKKGLVRRGVRVALPLSSYPHVSLGYALSAGQVMGAQFDKTLVAEARSAAGLYTQLSQHKNGTRVIGIDRAPQQEVDR